MTLTEAIKVLKRELPEDEYFSLEADFVRQKGQSGPDHVQFVGYCETQSLHNANSLQGVVDQMLIGVHNRNRDILKEAEDAFLEAQELNLGTHAETIEEVKS